MRLQLLVLFFICNFVLSVGVAQESPAATPSASRPRLSSYLSHQVASVSSANREHARQMALQFQAQLADPSKKKQLFVDLDPEITQEVFNKPGFFSGDTCQSEGKKSCQAVGSVSSESELASTGQIKFVERTSADEGKILTPFYEVSYQKDGRLQSGWVPGDRISFEPNMQQKINQQKKATQSWFARTCKSLTGISFAPGAHNNIDQLAAIHSTARQKIEDQLSAKPPVAEVAEKISGLVGQCMLETKPDSVKKDKNGLLTSVAFKPPDDVKGELVYDEKVIPSMLQKFETVRDLKIPGLNAQKIVEIDALARTIFAEIASCVPIGSQYLMAVTRVIRNRETAIETNPAAAKEFIYTSEQHWPGKSNITRLATSPVQFSAWNKDVIDFDALRDAREARAALLKRQNHRLSSAQAMKQAQEDLKPNAQTKAFYKFNESGLKQTLCPPSDLNKPYYDGHLPSNNLNEIWKHTVQTVVEASLYPEQFNRRTETLKEVLHYTSGRSSFYNFKQVRPSVEGQKINSDRCLNLWVKPPPKKKS